MSKAKNVKWLLKVKGFGPFRAQSNFSMEMNSSKAAIYAVNGQGKTALSRLFRALEEDDAQSAKKYMTQGASSATFTFEVADGAASIGTASVAVSANGDATIENRVNYLLHVFNSDYVRENLQEKRFCPDGNIDGYVIGKGNISADHERDELERRKKHGTELKSSLLTIIEEDKKRLTDLGVRPNTGEYIHYTYETLIDEVAQENCFDDKVEAIKKIDALPDDAAAPARLTFSASTQDLDSIANVLSTSYSEGELSKAFMDGLRTKHEFIQLGMDLNKGDVCPFCGRSYDEHAHSIIDEYDAYLNHRSSRAISEIRASVEQLKQLISSYNAFLLRLANAKENFDLLSAGFEKFETTDFPQFPDATEFANYVTALVAELEEKEGNLAGSFVSPNVEALRKALQNIESQIGKANALFDALDTVLEKRKGELKNLRKSLCVEALKRCRLDNDNAITEINSLREECRELQDEIKRKEEQGKKPKRALVANLMTKLLRLIFGEKYQFNQDDFTLTLDNDSLGASADLVLSDGEKSVIAFCYYLSTTYELFDEETDKERLFFVIDDPISSMDFHYVYGVVQIIRDLHRAFDFKVLRALVLTHNTAFFNMLLGNYVVREPYLLSSGKLERCGCRVIAPYSAHLKDIYAIACGEAVPTHTTGNSLRQILESLWHFEEPAISSLELYLKSERCTDLIGVSYLYSLCQDESHGALIFDSDQPIDDEAIRRACRAVIKHVDACYPGQLKSADIALGSGF